MSKESFQITYAKKGVFEDMNNSNVLVLFDGQTLNNNQGKITNFEFSKSDFLLGNMDTHLIVHKKIQEQSTLSLIKCIKSILLSQNLNILNCSKDNPRNVYRELIERIINPFYITLLILIASINILLPKENKNYFKFRFVIFVCGILMIIISESLLGYVDKSVIRNIFIISFPILSILTIYLIIFFKLKFKVFKLK